MGIPKPLSHRKVLVLPDCLRRKQGLSLSSKVLNRLHSSLCQVDALGGYRARQADPLDAVPWPDGHSGELAPGCDPQEPFLAAGSPVPASLNSHWSSGSSVQCTIGGFSSSGRGSSSRKIPAAKAPGREVCVSLKARAWVEQRKCSTRGQLSGYVRCWVTD